MYCGQSGYFLNKPRRVACRISGSETGRGRFRDLDADENIILKFFVKILYGGTDGFLVGQDKVQLEVLVNTVMNLRVLQSVQLSAEPTYRINKPAHNCVAAR